MQWRDLVIFRLHQQTSAETNCSLLKIKAGTSIRGYQSLDVG